MTSSSDYTVVMPKISQMSTFWNVSAPLLSGPYSGKIAQADYMTKLQQFDKDLAAAK
ncbi:maltose ABC transporter substrate-binding protein [Streptococcus sobrinus DSM 20742 = ATCC 33478]|nr:maltose ABC transporter substrate-binding protein [Streptococcus sobrinus DSM 20742 = ATCC 33478]